MTSLMYAVLLYAPLAAPGDDSYAAAYRETMDSGKPMVVLVSTEWCAPCQQMKRQTLPEVRRHGLLDRVSFAKVDPDHERALANHMIGNGPIPQLVMYRPTSDGWMRRKLIGGQSVSAVEAFINRGLALDTAAKQAEKQASVAEAAPGERLATHTVETP